VPGDIVSTTGQIDPNNRRLVHFTEGESVVIYKRDRTLQIVLIIGFFALVFFVMRANWPNLKQFLRKKLE